jgi:hypothetical protein
LSTEYNSISLPQTDTKAIQDPIPRPPSSLRTMDSRIPGQVGAPLGGDPALAFNTGHSAGIQALEELGVHDVSEKRTSYAKAEEKDEKNIKDEIRYVPTDEESYEIGNGMTAAEKVDNMEEIALYALHVEDDPSLNPWTMRTWFLGRPLVLNEPLIIMSNKIQGLDSHVSLLYWQQSTSSSRKESSCQPRSCV